jgi:hypothetical protein
VYLIALVLLLPLFPCLFVYLNALKVRSVHLIALVLFFPPSFRACLSGRL